MLVTGVWLNNVGEADITHTVDCPQYFLYWEGIPENSKPCESWHKVECALSEECIKYVHLLKHWGHCCDFDTCHNINIELFWLGSVFVVFLFRKCGSIFKFHLQITQVADCLEYKRTANVFLLLFLYRYCCLSLNIWLFCTVIFVFYSINSHPGRLLNTSTMMCVRLKRVHHWYQWGKWCWCYGGHDLEEEGWVAKYLVVLGSSWCALPYKQSHW